MMLKPARVHISYGLGRAGIPAANRFRGWVQAALAGARHRRAAELSIRIVDADEGRSFNRDYRGRDYATNVLSFPADLPPGIRLPLLGDLVICAPVVRQEATEQGKPVLHHYAHLTVHGVLHLLGYDHEESEQALRMEMLEQQILADMGIPDPYLMADFP